jgi:hypothetical protein
LVAQHALAFRNALGDRQIRKRIDAHRATLHRPCEGRPAIGGRPAGHSGAFGLVRAIALFALAAPCQGVQGAHDGRPVQILCGVVQVINEAVMQRAHRFCGVARPLAGKVTPVPIVNQHPQRETVARAPCALGRRRVLALGRRVPALRHVAHDGRGRFARLGECNRRTRAERHAPLVSMQRVLAQIGSAAACRHAHGKSTLRIVENEPVLATRFGRQLVDFPFGQLHDLPLSWSGSAAGPRTPSGPHRMTLHGGPWRYKSEGRTKNDVLQGKRRGPR